MTTIFETAAPLAPATHVLVIGVGWYPHLIDGAPGQLANQPLGLKQISSPPISAKRLIDWWLAPLISPGVLGFENASHPLGSLEALISSQSATVVNVPGGLTATPDPATFANVEAAFQTWLGRVKASPDNIGVFYFCGHGVSVLKDYLLAEDFGSSIANPWRGAFDITNTIAAVERDVEGTVYFLLDACREVSRQMALTVAGEPPPLWPFDLTKGTKFKSRSTIYAAGTTRKAFAPAQGVSRFTDALVTALSGYCGIKEPISPTWDADGETIATAVRKLLENGNKSSANRQVSEQSISGSSVPLTRTMRVPRVKLALDLSPEARRLVANLSLKSLDDSFDHDGGTGAFKADVPKGVYRIRVNAKAGEFVEVTRDNVDLGPPCQDFVLEI